MRFSDLEIGDHFRLKRGYPAGVWIKIEYVRRSMSYGGYDKLNGFAIQGAERKQFGCNLIIEKVGDYDEE